MNRLVVGGGRRERSSAKEGPMAQSMSVYSSGERNGEVSAYSQPTSEYNTSRTGTYSSDSDSNDKRATGDNSWSVSGSTR